MPLEPAAAVLQYGVAVFEGLKVYRHRDGSLAAFRPDANAARFRASAARMGMPELPEQHFLGARVIQRPVDTTEWRERALDGSLREVFASGTAAVLTPVGTVAAPTASSPSPTAPPDRPPPPCAPP